MHMAEFANEPDLIRERINDFPADQSVVEYFEKMGFLSDSLLIAHVIYADEEDMEILKRNGVGVAHNPKANSRANSGMAPAWDMFKMGLDIGLGTDGPMSSNQMDILNVMSHAAGVARFLGQDATRFTPYELVYMATMGGARALDMEDEIGSLEAGKKADIVIVDVHAPNMQPNYDPYATLAFAAYPQNVRSTIVNGKVVVDDGVLTKVALGVHSKEWAALTRRVAEYAKTLQ
jgi:cytosine/adenosine deaminase-related metal-dependent hydrolase